MPCLIAVEGIDGSGKGTQTALLTERLRDRGHRAACLRFPRYSETSFGQAIGDFLNGKFGTLDAVHPQLAAVLYAGDRFESREVLQALLQDNDVVILDRFIGSNLAHQAARLDGAAREKLITWIEDIEHRVFRLPRPDLCILLDISADWSRRLVSRKGERDYTAEAADLHERDLSYLERVRNCYRDLAASREDWTVVSCLDDQGELRTVDAIGQELLRLITPLPDGQTQRNPADPNPNR